MLDIWTNGFIDWDKAYSIASDITTNPETLHELVKMFNHGFDNDVYNLVAANPNASIDTLYYLFMLGDVYQRIIKNNPVIDLLLLESPHLLESWNSDYLELVCWADMSC